MTLNYDASDAANLLGLTSLGFTGSLSFTKADGTTATSDQGGSLSINGTSYSLLYTMDQLDAIDATSAVDGSTITGYGPGLAGHYALASSLDAGGTSYTMCWSGRVTAAARRILAAFHRPRPYDLEPVRGQTLDDQQWRVCRRVFERHDPRHRFGW